MAIFGNLKVVKEQARDEKFKIAFEYLEKVFTKGTAENARLMSLPLDAFEEIDLDNKNFGLEQVYISKDREKCFFESHKSYIDVQFILEGEEIIEVRNSSELPVDMPYDENMDLVKYKTTRESSALILKKGDIAIFYPEDAHMPCIRLDNSVKVVKTVVKVAI